MNASSGAIRSAEVTLIVLSGVFAYLLSFQIPNYPVFNESDHLIFVYEGWRMATGDVIYRDFFEFTFPGMQTYYFILIKLFGPVYWITSATVVAIATTSCWVLLKISRLVVPEPLHFVPALIYIFAGFRWFGLDPSHRMVSPIFALAAALILLKGNDLRHLIASGAMCAVSSFFTQQRGFAAVMALSVYLFICAMSRGENLLAAARKPIVISVAFLVALAILCLPFIIEAGPSLFFESTVKYPALYYGQAPPNAFGVYLQDLAKSFADQRIAGIFALLPALFFSTILPLAAVATAACVLWRRAKWEGRENVLLISLLSLFFLVSTAAPSPARLFQISMPLLVLMAWALGTVLRSGVARQLVTAGLAIVAISLASAQAFRFQTHWNFIRWETPTGTLAVVPSDSFERYRSISEQLAPGESLFDVLQPYAYFPLQLKNPTRYGQIWPYGYTRPEHVAEVVEDLRSDPPKYILWRNDYNVKPELRRGDDSTGPLADLVAHMYEPVGPIYFVEQVPVQVWRLKPQ